ncbi:peptidoglycan-binding protein [Gordonia sp. (in: high G+C Gram-positive bacteria)]|uniref:peptidoglycan-binding protein n=1 Tax=Gordonia sp. (in: high G+C Gram-positive bacteria) TaxID=84139 RepID=UPI0035271B91
MPAFEMQLSNPIRTGGRTQNYGGPGVGGHSFAAEWYIGYGMDLGAPGGTPVYAAFDGHVTRFNTGNIDKTSGKFFGAELFVRSPDDRMGGFYTHFREVPAEVKPGATISRGQYLGTLVPVAGSPHVHLALVEIIGTKYQGVNLYSWFDATVGSDAECTVTFHQDGSAPSIDGEGSIPSSGPTPSSIIDLRTVLGVQLALVALGYDPGTPDGIPGPRTTAAVRAFQSGAGLTADGVAGPNTRAALSAALSARGITSQS